MCSINGINFSDRGVVERMTKMTVHRGPDGSGVVAFPACTLGHDRLAIIDLSADAAQPMWNHDRTLCIVFNGEIYNYRELRDELRGRYAFRTKSDTEVLLALFESGGVAVLSRLNGIFAFGVWDVRREELTVARDPAGIKPLYYFWDGKTFAFSSEAKALLEVTGSPSLDRESLPLYLSLSYTPSPRTLFKGIAKLEAGRYAVLRKSSLTFGTFWHPPAEPRPENRRAAAIELRRRAENSVRAQMISDRPIGIFLSGGIDSTTLATMAARLSNHPLKTYTTRFEVSVDREKFNADADLAVRTARRLGAEHHELTIGPQDVLDDLETATWHLDEPNGNSTVGAMYRLAKLASNDAAVLLLGDGADELFGGYERYEKSRRISLIRKLPLSWRTMLAKAFHGRGFPDKHLEKLLIASDVDQYLSLWTSKDIGSFRPYREGIVAKNAVREFFRQRYFPEDNGLGDFENRMMTVDRRTWLVDESLLRTDKLLAASGVEGRVPWLDLRMIAFAEAVPSSWKIRRPWQRLNQDKRVWIDAVRDLLSPDILAKPKTGWSAPMAKWLREPFVYRAVRERLGSLPAEIFDRDETVRMLDSHRDVRGYHLQTLWALVSLQAWLERFRVSV